MLFTAKQAKPHPVKGEILPANIEGHYQAVTFSLLIAITTVIPLQTYGLPNKYQINKYEQADILNQVFKDYS